MSKEHSEQDTRLTPNKFSHSRKIHSVVAETQRAFQHYIHFRKEELQTTRKQFLEQLQAQRIEQKTAQKQPEGMSRKRNKEKKKKKEIAKQKPVRQIERRSRLRRVDYRQRSESSSPIMPSNRKMHSKSSSLSSKSESSCQKYASPKGNSIQDDLQAVGTYQIKPVHECMLELQKAIDSFLDYQFVHRRRYSVSQQDLFQFLKTTKYGLKCRKYFDYIKQYNPNLYSYKDNRISCKQLSSQDIEERSLQTRTRMTQKEIIELLI